MPDVWLPPPVALVLPSNEVHVWRAPLIWPAADMVRFRETLTADEHHRANRFYFERDRKKFIAGRGLLRALLGCYLNYAPAQLRFGYTAYGKPYLCPDTHDHTICFNLSHSGDWALYAFATERQLGIDIEQMRPNVDYEALAERFFSPTEVSLLRTMPPSLKRQAFFNGWTRKEAYIKARGQGLSIPLDSFDVTLTPGQPARLLATRDDPAASSCWTLKAFNLEENYAGAMVTQGDDKWTLKQWHIGPRSVEASKDEVNLTAVSGR